MVGSESFIFSLAFLLRFLSRCSHGHFLYDLAASKVSPPFALLLTYKGVLFALQGPDLIVSWIMIRACSFING
jgi:hypothetical protein